MYIYVNISVWVCALKLVRAAAAAATISTVLCKHRQQHNNHCNNIWRTFACFSQICLCQILNPQANARLSQLFLVAGIVMALCVYASTWQHRRVEVMQIWMCVRSALRNRIMWRSGKENSWLFWQTAIFGANFSLKLHLCFLILNRDMSVQLREIYIRLYTYVYIYFS